MICDLFPQNWLSPRRRLTERQVEAARSHSELAAALQHVQQQLALTLTEFTAVKAEFDEKERLLTEQRVALEAKLREAREQVASSAAQFITSRAELAHQKEDAARQRGELETALHQAERSLQVVVHFDRVALYGACTHAALAAISRRPTICAADC